MKSQLISGETWSWPVGASSAHAARSTRARSCRRTQSCTVQAASGACKMKSHRSVSGRRSSLHGKVLLACVQICLIKYVFCFCFFFVLQPQTLQLDFLMKILPNYHHLKKTVKGNSTPVRNWTWIQTDWLWHISLNLHLSYTVSVIP